MISVLTFLAAFGLEDTCSRMVKRGDVFGRLIVVEVGQIPHTYRYMAICACTCGNLEFKVIRQDSLIAGTTVSCGCYHKEQTTKHGLSKSPLYGRWKNMLDRCYNPACTAYPDYGGRGIKVCEAWHDIKTYILHVGFGYKEGLELDRIDNDGDYEPANVRWATVEKNCNNRRSCCLLTYAGQTKTMTEWAKEYKISNAVLRDRLEVLKWGVTRALTTPIAERIENMRKTQAKRWEGHIKAPRPEPRILNTFSYQGKKFTMAELSELSGIPIKLLRKRICERGWKIERAVTEK